MTKGNATRTASLTSKQHALIRVARTQLGLEEDEYRALLVKVAGVTSSKALDAAGFTAVMARFKELGFDHRPSPASAAFGRRGPALGSRPGMATDKQLDLIRALWIQWHGADNERALGRWLQRSYHVAAPRFLTVHVGQQAITGLRKMLEDKAHKGAAVQPVQQGE